MSSFILKHWNEELVQFALNEMNKHVFFKTLNLRKKFIDDFLVQDDQLHSISIRIGYIAKELIELGILTLYRNYKHSYKRVYKNLYKGSLFDAIEQKMDEKYTIIRLKGKV